MSTIADLTDAVNRSDLEAVKTLVQENAGLAGRHSPDGDSLILAAMYRGREDIAQVLAERTSLDVFEATAFGNTERVLQVVERDPALHRQFSKDGWTALHLAAFFGRRETTEFLLSKGADLSLFSKNSTANQPLHAAIAGKMDHGLVELLVAQGADVNARAGLGVTPLHLAASRGDATLVEMLQQKGADSQARMEDGTTPDEIALNRGHEAVAKQIKAYVKTA